MTPDVFHCVSHWLGLVGEYKLVCQLYGATTGIAGLVTINTLAAISYDRYTVMVRRVGPVRYISKQMTLMVIVTIWVMSSLWVVAPLLGWSSFTLEGLGTTCTFDYLTTSTKNRSYVVTLMVTNFLAPLVVIIYSYGRIFMSVASVRQTLMDCSPQIAVGTQTQRLRFRHQTEIKTATTIFMIVCFFCVAWTPYCIVALIGLYGDVSLARELISDLKMQLAS
nr:hypothetical protein BaRGS_000423 [Batillaria attramentaria]